MIVIYTAMHCLYQVIVVPNAQHLVFTRQENTIIFFNLRFLICILTCWLHARRLCIKWNTRYPQCYFCSWWWLFINSSQTDNQFETSKSDERKKNISECHYQHYNESCPTTICKDQECKYRHLKSRRPNSGISTPECVIQIIL